MTARASFWVATLVALAFGFAIIYLATLPGAGLSPDSVTYIEGAKSILRLGDFSALRPNYPPLYSLLIAAVDLVVGDTLLAVRALQIGTFVLLVFLFGYVLRKTARYSVLTGTLGMLLVISSPVILKNGLMAWTEGLFCLFSLLACYFLANYVDRRRYPELLLAGLAASSSLMMRYVGVVVVLVGLLALTLHAKSFRCWLRETLLFGATSCALLALWLVRNLMARQSATGLSFDYHPVSADQLRSGIGVIAKWFYLPVDASKLWLLLLVGVILWAYGSHFRRREKPPGYTLAGISLLLITVYSSFLLFSISFLNAHTPLSPRILSPLFLFGLLAVLLLSPTVGWRGRQEELSKGSTRVKEGIAYAALALLLLAQLVSLREALPRYVKYGVGYANRSWRMSDTLRYLRGQPEGAAIYANGTEPILLYLNRSAQFIPRLTSPLSKRRNPAFSRQIEEMAQSLRQRGGSIVYFKRLDWRRYLPDAKKLSSRLPLEQVFKASDGVVLRLKSTARPQ